VQPLDGVRRGAFAAHRLQPTEVTHAAAPEMKLDEVAANEVGVDTFLPAQHEGHLAALAGARGVRLHQTNAALAHRDRCGRFVLGLGPTVRSWCQGIFGMPYGKPLEHLREAVEVIRLIIAKSHTGELKNFKGKYYEMDFSEFQPLAEPVRTNLPIWLSALRGPIIELGAEIAEGIASHPIWSIHWATSVMPKHLKIGLDRAGKQRSDVHVNCWFWMTPNTDVKQSIEDARATVAFYGGVEQYEEYFAAHGFREEAKKLQEGVKRGDYRSVAHLVPDEMASTFVVTGTPDEVAKKIEPVWEFADSMCLVPPVLTLPPEKSLAYFATIAQTFYA